MRNIIAACPEAIVLNILDPPPCLFKIMLLASAIEDFWVIFFNMDTFSELEILREIGLYLHFHIILVLGNEHVI